MDPGTASALSAVFGGGALFLSAIYSARAQHRASAAASKAAEVTAEREDAEDRRSAQISADAGAYQRAQAIDTQMVERLLAELRRLEAQIVEMRKALDERDDEMVELRRQLQLALLTIERMRHLLDVNGIAIPPGFNAGM